MLIYIYLFNQGFRCDALTKITKNNYYLGDLALNYEAKQNIYAFLRAMQIVG